MTATADQSTEMAQLEIVKGANGELCVGGLRFSACRREVGSIDGGITLYVFSDLPGDDREFLRVDLFRNRPHYHAPADNRAETKIELDATSDARAWGIDAMTNRASELIAEGGFEEAASRIDGAALAQAGPALRRLFDELPEPTEVSYFDVPKSVLDGLSGG